MNRFRVHLRSCLVVKEVGILWVLWGLVWLLVQVGCASEGDLRWALVSDLDNAATPEEATSTPAPVDEDGDGFTVGEGDCDDTDPQINPDSDERCNQLDDNCDGKVDEGLLYVYYPDEDGDGYGSGQEGINACSPVDGYVQATGDCDDQNPEVNPEAIELCDAIDNNCDGVKDEGLSATYYADQDGDGFGSLEESIYTCSPPPGYVADAGDCDDQDDRVHPGQTEVCDGLDNNCNGYVDEGVESTWYLDGDGDGFGGLEGETMLCEGTVGYVANSDDCNDGDPFVYPGAMESCDGMDDDCDGLVDEDFDQDGDGFGPCGSLSDCDDQSPTIYPGAEEVCDAIDNDCDGLVDEDAYEPNNSLEEAAVLLDVDGGESPNVTLVTGTIHEEEDSSDFYLLNLVDEESRQVDFYIEAQLTDLPLAINLDLYLWWDDPLDEVSDEIEIIAESARAGTADEQLVHEGAPRVEDGGRYWLEVRRVSGQVCGAEYTLRIDNGG